MNNYLVQFSLSVPAEDKAKAEEKLREFFSCIYIGGKPIQYDISHVQEVLIPDEAKALGGDSPLGQEQ